MASWWEFYYCESQGFDLWKLNTNITCGTLVGSPLIIISTPVFNLEEIWESTEVISEGMSPKTGHDLGFMWSNHLTSLSLLMAMREEEGCHPVTQRGNFYTPDSMQSRGHQSSQLGCFILKVFSEGRWEEQVTELHVQKRKKFTRACALKVPHSKIKKWFNKKKKLGHWVEMHQDPH